MIKLLILAYDFPPYVSVGSLRPNSWSKHLHLFEVFPVVVTRQWSNKFKNSLDYISPGYSDNTETETTEERIIIKTPFKPNLANRILLKHGESRYRLMRKSISLFYLFAQYVFPVGNAKEIYFAADEYLKSNQVDCIIATGDPFVLFKYASELSEKYSVPWVADYRDSWIQDKTMSNRLYKTWSAFFERRILRNAAKVTTVSTFIQKQIETNVRGKEFVIIYNGYDPKIIEATKNIRQRDDRLSVAFTGTIYEWHPIESFLRTCNEIISEDENFGLSLNFYGINKEAEIKNLLREKYVFLESLVSFFPRMENLALAEELAKHNACLLFNDYSILGTKIFDYVAVRRKIILCYENDDEANKLKVENYCLDETELESRTLQADMIMATNSGIVVRDSAHLKRVLRELNQELKENGFIECSPVDVERHSRIKQVEKLARVIEEVTK